MEASTPSPSGGFNPNWNFPVNFTVDESLARQNRLSLVFKIKCESILGDKDIGEVSVPVKELLTARKMSSDIWCIPTASTGGLWVSFVATTAWLWSPGVDGIWYPPVQKPPKKNKFGAGLGAGLLGGMLGGLILGDIASDAADCDFGEFDF